MTHQRWVRVGGLVTGFAVTGLLVSGCAGGSAPTSTPSSEAVACDPDADVTITVGERPTPDQTANLEAWENAVAQFEDDHPNITIDDEETKYDVSTFPALLVGGTLPTTLQVPFTDIQSLIERGQAADITTYVENDDVLSQLNPQLKAVTEDADGHTYGVVRAAYTMGLIYDRALFTEAGLDPDAPPATWDEVLDAAATISEQTGQTGFIIPTTANTGGWLLTSMSYSNGNLVEEVDGDTTTVTLDTPGMEASLQFLHDVRWEEDAAGANFLYDNNAIRDDIAAGSIGQSLNGANLYNSLVIGRGMPKEDFGLAPFPTGDDPVGVLGGGNIQWFNPKATPDQLCAALEWTKFYFLNRYVDEEAAVTWAEAQVADDLPVGLPEVPVVSDEQYETYLGWIEPYINVPRENYTAYLDSLATATIVPEPAKKAQELYAALDPVVQAVLTREDADFAELLESAQTQVQDLVDAG
ncbi:ABC transporter substrate-binding protein [Microbacterium trichothecenolyticum]|uniref:Bacterial extracellular solute-binding protein n=1 Tax=Microbacterium trichothecenolyticum TaxID=69370 RepID=A0A0M2HJH6_MICTR|nr:extracellular solute-binding protein [Microbacterium trichothecenolyticum]KJL44489.1 Bacterial extracellular solute-binding protein [Microbacterium trichothecenolyticum]